jgi:hypothetical protein
MVKVDDWQKWKLIENARGISLFSFYIPNHFSENRARTGKAV